MSLDNTMTVFQQLFTTSIENTSYTNLYTVQCIGLVLFFEYELLAEVSFFYQVIILQILFMSSMIFFQFPLIS